LGGLKDLYKMKESFIAERLFHYRKIHISF